MKNDKKKKSKYAETKSQLVSKFGRFVKYLKIIVVVLVIGIIALLWFLISFDINLTCAREQNMCYVTKTTVVDRIPSRLGSFSTLRIKEVNVTQRVIDGGKSVYDLELDRGDDGKEFVGFTFGTVIKANTAKMQFSKYLENLALTKLEIKKHCYFSDYFCF